MNCAKIHPIQITGVTNLINYAKKLSGAEIPFRNFRYIYENSLFQWLHGEGDINEEIINMWSYQNDWNANELQKNVLQTLIYSKYEDLENYQFPMNLKTIWTKNWKNIQFRITVFDPGKTKYVERCLKLLRVLN